MTTRTVTGNIRSLTDSAVATGTVTFEKIVTSTTGTTIHQSGVTTATTDSSGDFSIALAVPASGSYRYRMILPNGASFYFSTASGASVNVATLIIAETITDQDEVVEALTAYLPLAGGTMTGALTLSGAPTVDLHAATKKYVDDNAGGGGASDVTDLTTTTGNPAEMVRVAGAGGLEYRTVAQVLADLQDSGALAVTDIGTTVQGYDADLAAIAALSPSNDDVVQRKAGAWTNRTMAQLLSDLSAKLNAINALTWASNSLIWLTGTATASVQALAAHIVTFLQSATAADARAAIGAGTGNGDLLAANNLSDVTASTARTNLGLAAGGAGDIWVEKAGDTMTGVLLLPNGASNAPSMAFSGDAQTGLYRAASGRIDFVSAGSTSLLVSGSNVRAFRILESVVTDAATTTQTAMLTLYHNSSGTAAAGFGSSIVFNLETSTTNDTAAGRVAVLWNTATHASRVPDMVAYLTDASAEREILRGRATGSAAAIGFLGATPVARQAHIADASGDDAATVNAILDVLEAFGLVATS